MQFKSLAHPPFLSPMPKGSGRWSRNSATSLGTWIVLLVLFIYGPILIVPMFDPSTAVKVVGINYFADTLLFAGAILVLVSAAPRTG
jgi:hypothetical protein